MKLVNCYVSSFGKLKDFSYDFGGGLNTIKQDNGWGKSTLATFIKAMFYGLDDGKRTLEDNERKKFAPWNATEKFGGNLTFVWKGGSYRIERFFGTKSSEDSIKLYDLSTNKVYTEGGAVENLGKRVFSIDEEGFLSTTYFSQKDFEIKSNTSITAKFNEVCEIQDSDGFDKALVKLDEKIRELKARGDKGRIFDLKRSILSTEEKIERAKQSVKAIENLKGESALIKAASEEFESKIKELTAKVEKAGKRDAAAERRKRYDALNLEISELKARKADAERLLNGKEVSAAEAADCDKCIRDLYDLSVKADTLKADLSEYAPSGKTDSATLPKRKSKTFIIFSVIAALLIIAGAVVSATGALWGLSFIGAGVIVAVFVAASMLSANKRTFNEREENNRLLAIYERKKAAASECERSVAELQRGLDGYFSAFVFPESAKSYESKADALKDAVKVRDECAEKLEKRAAELREIKAQGVEVSDGGAESVAELNEQLTVATEWYKSKINEYERVKSRINALENETDALIDLENGLAEKKAQLYECEKELKTLTLTAEFMKKADEALKIRYRAPLQSSLNKYIGMIAGAELAVNIDTDMKVSVSVSGAERETEFFSKGYRNLFEICKRFALTDILFTVEKPFIILDDPFYNLDDDKVSAALALIKRLSEEYQIIYLVCHESRRA